MVVYNYLNLFRVKQWTKNFFVFAPLLFALEFNNEKSLLLSAIAFLCFTLISSAIYTINDINDVNEDKAHPVKKLRPLASGKINIYMASFFAFVFIIISLATVYFYLPRDCLIIAFIYIIMQLLYTFKLKEFAIIDVLIIATGFILRILLGGYAIDVPISPWIIITTYLLATFLGFSKRYHEISIKSYASKRASLKTYNKELLNSLIIISCVAALVSYALYTVETARIISNTNLVYTVVFVIFGLFRYLQLLYANQGGGEPETVIFKDRLFFINGVVWLVVTLWVLS